MSDFKGRHFRGEIVLWAALLQSPMGWTPPPDGIAMCQGGDCSSRPEGGGIHGRG